jgi:hypothetical protein
MQQIFLIKDRIPDFLAKRRGRTISLDLKSLAAVKKGRAGKTLKKVR